MKLTAGIETLDIADAFVDGRAAFEHERPVSLLGQKVSRHESARSRANNNRPMLKWGKTR